MEQQLLGESPEFHLLLRTAALLAPTDATVLISGESGTGKELIAQYLHRHSGRARGPWVSINCAALPESLAESELFGHGRGAFTGALERRLGRAQAAAGGTLFLDEISELPLAIQPKLLRLLESGECQMIGQSQPSRVDVRIIAATNRTLADMVQGGRFRADLFYRLNVVPLELPPLRARSGDVPILLQAFLQTFATRNHQPPSRLAPATLALLQAHSWPGNIRELRNLCERLSILHGGRTIDPGDLPDEIRTAHQPRMPANHPAFVLPETGINLERLEQSLLAQALRRTAGNKSRAARLLGLSRDTFLYRLKKFAVSV
ncbi:MAG: sigma-54-dependent Fis family transcriptional regulator [Magnetococcales bacterium]|nr:sigma-54-dependent Fis family transcriptional regulator [Magnetococcales bacterium]